MKNVNGGNETVTKKSIIAGKHQMRLSNSVPGIAEKRDQLSLWQAKMLQVILKDILLLFLAL